MFIAKIVGSLVSTHKVEKMVGQKLLVIEPYRLTEDRTTMQTTGRSLVAVDTVGAGEHEYVLVCQGSSARGTEETKNLPVDATIIGIVDSVIVGKEKVRLQRE
ncbi:MAG: EutN/CcmL family microcompartment protein [Planctomycetaceae bacterium]|jgi:ethanolamine utilization protein EutN|nr:EutN/CcmL family microcompartment protein [Planctomycetaceae bacterium]